MFFILVVFSTFISTIDNVIFDKCGICGEDRVDIFWYSPSSRGAHKKCFNKISHIDRFFTEQNENHAKFIGLVDAQIKTKDYRNIMEYYEKEGELSLKKVYEKAMQQWITLNK